ncbi:IS701 family transposase [Nocardiopsis sp. FR6]|uniref:IS701 family transposase n=1 Tax=Nocardiopsis sp. FR6 TaxID=2605986 RepID=UPI0019154BE0|nr:IS701 family transposase [Nocardiopsis sp. FR6]
MTDLDTWSRSFSEFTASFAHRFPRIESRRQATSYLRGLLSELERKNGWTLAETCGERGPERLQRLLNFYAWDTDGLRDDVRALAVEALGDPDHGVLILDDTGFLKKGTKSAGVARQYSGTAGRIENCQIGVFLAYASPRGRALIDRELYLPQAWPQDRDRCRAAGIGDEVAFATRNELGPAMLKRALASGIPFGWVTADEAYGQVSRLRMWMEQHGIHHVVAVPKSQTVVAMDLRMPRAHQVVAEVPERAWERLNCGDGAHGPRIYDWARADIRPWREPGKGHWLLARRSITDPTDIAYYICFADEHTPLAELARIAGARWAVQECFQVAKNETGLDHYQVRGYRAWYRHITLSMAALVFLVRLRRDVQKGDQDTPRACV